MDVIIEDGMQTFEGRSLSVAGSIQNLRPGGIYVIEDIAKKERLGDGSTNWQPPTRQDSLIMNLYW
jgi:hypothetical protein